MTEGRPEAQDEDAIALIQANERLRQERAIFDRQLGKDRQWNRLQIASACVALTLLPAIAVLCTFIVLDAASYPDTVVAGASAALFVDVVSLGVTAYRALIPSRKPSEGLVPVTADPRGIRAPTEATEATEASAPEPVEKQTTG